MLDNLLLLQPPVAPTPRDDEHRKGIDQLAFLVGGTWVAHPIPDKPTAAVTEACRWGPEDVVILTHGEQKLDGHVVATAIGVFSYDPKQDALHSNSASSLGDVQSADEVDRLSHGHTWTFNSTIHGPGGVRRQLVTIKQLGPDEMTLTSAPLPEDGGPPGVAVTVAYHREPDST